MTGDKLRDASEQEPSQAFFAMSSQHNQVGTPLVGNVENCGSNFVFGDARFHLESGRAKRVRSSRSGLTGLLQPLFDPGSHFRGVARGHLWRDRIYKRFHNVKNEHFGACNAKLRC